jgi:lipopolysaccharide assembly outer membrane protein LptD (OstA)
MPALFAADKKPVIITGDRVTTRLIGTENNKKIYLTELTGNPKIKYGDKELSAAKIIIRGSEGEISEAIGNVRLIDIKKKSKITSQKAVYNKLKDTTEFTGRPIIITKRDDDNSQVTIKADRLEYNIEDDIGYAYGKIFLTNKETNIYSDKAVFNRKKGEFVFMENPLIKKGEDTVSAEQILYYTDKKMLLLNKDAHAEMYSEKKDSQTGKPIKTKTVITGSQIENYEENEKLTVIYGSESVPAVIEREDAVFSGSRIEIRGDKGENVSGNNIYINYKTENIESKGNYFNSVKSKQHSVLRGNAVLIVKDEKTNDETSRIYGDFMEFFEDINELHMFGNIRIHCDAGIIKGKMAKYTRNDNNMLVSGNAMIEKKDSVLYSRQILFNTKTNNTEMIGEIKGHEIK